MEAQGGNGNDAIRIVVASDIRLYREALEHAFSEASGLQVAAATSSAAETLVNLTRFTPDVILLDMGMDDAFAVARHLPHISPRTRIVALGMHESETEIIACAEVGVAGYVPRGGSLSDAFEAVRAVTRGELRCSARIAGFLFRHIATRSQDRASAASTTVPTAVLTAREAQILKLLQEGLSNKMISRSLGIELATVKNHVHSLLGKLGVHRRAEAVTLTQRWTSLRER